MAVAAADFYSYAKATGTPLPKSKQEEAQLAPAVNNWKKARLKAPERERDSGDLGNVLGGGAIAAGLAGAALYGYRRGWGDSPASRKPAPTGDLPSEIPTNLYKGDERGIKLGKKPVEDTTTTYRSAVTDIPDQPQASTQFKNTAAEEALWDANYWAYFHAIKRANPSWNIADIDKQAVLAAKQATNQPIRKGYVPGPATDNRISLQEIPESSPVEFSPLEYIKSTGAVEPTNVSSPQITGTEPKGLLSQDFVQRALDETKPSYAQEFTKDELDALRGIRFAVKDIQNEGKPKFYENRGIDLDRISNAPKIKTGTFLDNAIGNLPATVIAADEVARRGVKDIGDAARGIKKVVVENAPSNVPDLSRVPESGINTSPTVQLSDGSAVGPLYPFKQFIRGLTGDESVDIVEPNTLVGQQKTIASELADQSLESANSGYQQMADPIERFVQRDTDSVAIGNKAAQVEALQQELLVGQRSNLGPKPVTTQTRQDGFYTSPRRLSSEAKQYARTGDIGSFTGEAFGGSRLAGATNVPVQRGTPAGGQLQLPIVYSTQDKINPALRTQLVNEGPTYYSKPGEFQRVNTDPTYTSVDEYLARFEPVKEEIIESPLAKKIARQDLIDNFYQTQREDQLIKAGLRPGTTRFENALASGWSAKPNIKQTITGEAFRENVVLPKEVEDYISTKIPETDASNVARNYYDPDTGDIQYPTVKGDALLTRDIYKERVIDNEDLKNAASGTSIRGTSRSMDIQEPKVFTRTDEFTGDERPDRIGGTLPTGGVPVEIDGQKTMNIPAGLRLTKNVYGPLPAGRIEAPQLSKQEVIQSIVNPSSVSREDLTGGGAGMGVYGKQLGYVPGPNSKTVTKLRSTGLRAKPTDVPETKKGREFNP